MKYQANQIYHVFNQGNNKQLLFFNRPNYDFFIQKVKRYFLPNVDILSYCLMPNHFHFLIWMKEYGCQESELLTPGYTLSGNKYDNRFQPRFSRDLSIMLRTYTRAINIQNSRTGSLFRSKTKCKQASNDTLIHSLNQSNILSINYDQTCFNYIHQNPVKAGLVRSSIDWRYSSAREYAKMPSYDICNKELASELNLIFTP